MLSYVWTTKAVFDCSCSRFQTGNRVNVKRAPLASPASRRRHHHEPSGPLRRVAHAHGRIVTGQRCDGVDRGTVDAVLARRCRELGARLAERLLPDRGSLLRSCQAPHTRDDEQEHHDRGVDEDPDAFAGLAGQQLQRDHRGRDQRRGRKQGEPQQPEGPLVAGRFGQ